MLLRLFIVILIIIIDQLSKVWAINCLKDQTDMSLLPGILDLTYRENTGIAFSMLYDKPGLLLICNSLIILVLIAWAIKQPKANLGLLFIIAGGIGNLLDRFIHGHVIDFINPIFVNFAVFNLADVALNIGVVLLLWSNLRKAS